MEKPRTTCKPAFIYCTWGGPGGDVSTEFVKRELGAFKKLYLHPDVFIIDAGYCVNGDWLKTNANFPNNGLKEAAGLIQEQGIIPGLWLGPFLVDPQSELFNDHPDWLIKDKATGKPKFIGMHQDSDPSPHTLLDLRLSEPREYIKSVLKQYKEWGFGFIKADFLIDAFFLPVIEPQEALDLVCEVLTMVKEAGMRVEGCGAPMATAYVADYFRVTSDSGLPIGVKPRAKDLPMRFIKTTIANVIFTDTIYRNTLSRAEAVKSITGCNPDLDMLYCRTLPPAIAKQFLRLTQKAINQGYGFTLGEDMASEELPGWYIRKIQDLEKLFREQQASLQQTPLSRQ